MGDDGSAIPNAEASARNFSNFSFKFSVVSSTSFGVSSEVFECISSSISSNSFFLFSLSSPPCVVDFGCDNDDDVEEVSRAGDFISAANFRNRVIISFFSSPVAVANFDINSFCSAICFSSNCCFASNAFAVFVDEDDTGCLGVVDDVDGFAGSLGSGGDTFSRDAKFATREAEACSARVPTFPCPSNGRCQKILTNLLLKTASSVPQAARASSLLEKLTKAFFPIASTATLVTVPYLLNQLLTASRERWSSGIFSTTIVLLFRPCSAFPPLKF